MVNFALIVDKIQNYNQERFNEKSLNLFLLKHNSTKLETKIVYYQNGDNDEEKNNVNNSYYNNFSDNNDKVSRR